MPPPHPPRLPYLSTFAPHRLHVYAPSAAADHVKQHEPISRAPEGAFYIFFALAGWRAGYTGNSTFAKVFMMVFPAAMSLDLALTVVSPRNVEPVHLMVWSLTFAYFFKVRSYTRYMDRSCLRLAAPRYPSVRRRSNNIYHLHFFFVFSRAT